MTTLDTLTGKVLELRAKVREENLARMAIEDSPRCKELDEQIKRLTAERTAMFIDCTDSVPELEAAKKELMAEFKSQNLSEYQGIKAEYKLKKEVNANQFMRVLDGDLDLFVTFANVTQVKVKEAAELFPEKKKDLMDCIAITEQTISDLILPDSLPSTK